ncbi:hypothetical protein SLS62_002175 [Diatrype stigma]|uniref:Uncharacterized protein n=1 Tax=Diatrype stigma TaxID=117547 RepID=A0AAN9V9A6_9PEZI
MDRQQSWSFADLPPERPLGGDENPFTTDPFHENAYDRQETDPEPSPQYSRSHSEKMRTDPILNLWLDPVGTIADTVAAGSLTPHEKLDILEDENLGWAEHFLKGMFSLGLLGFAKAFLAMSPWQWWNLRTSGVIGGGGRRGATGRDRMENISLTLVLIGVLTFLWAVWKGTRSWTERTLDRASERIENAHRDNDDSDDEDDDGDQEGAGDNSGDANSGGAADDGAEPKKDQ